MRLNILHITTIGEKTILEQLSAETDMGGGIGISLLRIVKVLRNELNCVNVITTCAEGNFLKEAKKEGLEIHVIRSKWLSFLGRPLFILLSVPQLVNLMKARQIDIVHTHNFAAALTGGIAAKIAKIPMIISVHQDITEYKTLSKNIVRKALNQIRGKINNKIYRFASQFGKSIIAVSNYVKESLIKNGFDKSKITVLYNGISISDNKSQNGKRLRLREQICTGKNSFLVGSVGRLHKDKGYQCLIEAAPEIIKQIPEVKFVLIGDGDERGALEAMVRKLRLSEYFTFIGQRNDVPDLLKELDLFVSTSFSEGFGLAIIEAMLAIKPIVATNVGAVPELIENEKTGMLIPPRNQVFLSRAIISLYKDKSFTSYLAKNAYRRAIKDFDLEKVASETFNIYQGLIGKKETTKKILVLNIKLSGVNKHLFGALKKKGWALEFINVSVPRLCRYVNLLRTFIPNKKKWRDKYYETLGKTASSFIRRTRFCERAIKKLKKRYDVIFQIGGMFAPSLTKLSIPYVTYNDYTMKLAKKEYSAWAPFKSEKQAAKWFWLEEKLYKDSSKVLTFSNRTGQSVQEDYGVDRNKVVTVGSGANLENIPVIQDKAYDKNTILFIGIDFKRKGGYVLLEAFKRVKKEIPDAKLIIVGPDNLEVDLPDVEFKGLIKEHSQVEKLYREACLFVMPSLADPFPNVIFEAMAYKLPCVGTDVSGIPEQIEDGKTGFIVPANDAGKLAERIIKLLKDKKLLRQMGENGYRKVVNVFNWDKVVERINNELENIIGMKSGEQIKVKNNKIKVMHISYSLDTGGLEKLILSISRNLDKNAYSPSVCSLSNGLGLHPEFARFGLPVHVRPKKDRVDPPLVLKLAGLFRQMRVDLIHTHNPTALLYGGPAAKIAGKRLIHTEHSNLYKHKRKLMMAESMMLRLTDCIVCDTNEVKEEIKRAHGINEDKINV